MKENDKVENIVPLGKSKVQIYENLWNNLKVFTVLLAGL